MITLMGSLLCDHSVGSIVKRFPRQIGKDQNEWTFWGFVTTEDPLIVNLNAPDPEMAHAWNEKRRMGHYKRSVSMLRPRLGLFPSALPRVEASETLSYVMIS